MRILIGSYAFAPSIGGAETVSRLLAEAFVRQGHDVKLVTTTPSSEPDAWPFEVIRTPKAAALLTCLRWCDIHLQNGLSLRLGWPRVLVNRPTIVAQFGFYGHARGVRDWRTHAKVRVLRLCEVIAVSQAVRDDLPADIGRAARVIHNPYDDVRFKRTNGATAHSIWCLSVDW